MMKNILQSSGITGDDCIKYQNIYYNYQPEYEDEALNEFECDQILFLLSHISIYGKPVVIDNIVYTGYDYEFYIKGLEGWKFGIVVWEDKEKFRSYSQLPLKYRKRGYIFFCQYEENINKFTPSNSIFKTDLELLPIIDNEELLQDYFFPYKIEKILNFIYRHKYIAIYRDLTGYDIYQIDNLIYDYLYLLKFNYYKIKTKIGQHCLDKIMIKKLIKLLGKHYPKQDIKIIDCGEDWSPRYEARILVNRADINPEDKMDDLEIKCPLGIYTHDDVEHKFYQYEHIYIKLLHMLGLKNILWSNVSTCFSYSQKKGNYPEFPNSSKSGGNENEPS